MHKGLMHHDSISTLFNVESPDPSIKNLLKDLN